MDAARADAASIQAAVLKELFPQDSSSTIVLISGLPWWYSESALEASLTQEVAAPSSVYIALHPSSGVSSGFAFANFSSSAHATLCAARWPSRAGLPTEPTVRLLSAARELVRFIGCPVGQPPLPKELDDSLEFVRAFDAALAPPASWPFLPMRPKKFE